MKQDYEAEKAGKKKVTNRVMAFMFFCVLIFIFTIIRLAVRDL